MRPTLNTEKLKQLPTTEQILDEKYGEKGNVKEKYVYHDNGKVKEKYIYDDNGKVKGVYIHDENGNE